MKCLYYYKGRLIGDILQLDDFLLSKQKFESSLGDMVFLLSASQMSTIKSVEDLEEESKKMEDDYKKAKASYIDGEELLTFPKPYRGVTEFLSGHKNEEGRLLFPEFIADNYWSNRYYAWNLGRKQLKDRFGRVIQEGFTEEEIELFFGGDDSNLESKRIPIGDPSTWMKNQTEFKSKWGTKQQNELRAKVENKWKKQAQFGTELHNVLSYYFSKDERTGKYHYENIHGALSNTTIANLKKRGLISENTDYEKIKQLIKIADLIKNDLLEKFGKNAVFFSEITISAQMNKEMADKKGYDKLLGRVDLMVIDESGNAHIVDFKVSPKLYSDYNSAKELAYIYQLATYERILRSHNIKTQNTNLYVAPIQLEGFKLDDNGEWNYTGVTFGGADSLVELTKQNESANIDNNINEYISVPVYIDADADDIIQKVKTLQKLWWPTLGEQRQKTLEEVKQMIEADGGFVLEDGVYKYESKHGGYEFKAKSEAALYNKVLQFYNGLKERNVKNTGHIINALKEALKRNDYTIEGKNITPSLSARLSKYASKQWEVVEGTAGEALLLFGIIMLRNKYDNLYEIVKISNSTLNHPYNWNNRKVGDNVLSGKRTNLTGALEPDINEDSKSDSLMLKATNGNLELMEAILVLNCLDFGGESINIGRIDVINPAFSSKQNEFSATWANNKELRYCWNKLNELKPIESEDRFKEGKIKLISSVENCYRTFKEIMDLSAGGHEHKKLKEYESLLTLLNSNGENYNRETVLSALYELEKKLLKDYSFLRKDIDKEGKSIHKSNSYYHQEHAKIMYQMIQRAILELHNMDVRQMDPTKDNFSPKSLRILTEGISSNMLDNANNFANKILNEIANLSLEGYLNTRDQSLPKITKIRRMVEEIKHDIGFSGLKEYTYGNLADLYKGMTRYTTDGDLRFLNPWKENTLELTPKQVEFLKYVILEINRQIHPTYSEEQIQLKIENDDIEFFQVPLMKASTASKISTEGWLGWLKSKLKPFSGIRSLGDLKKRMSDWAKRKESQFFDAEQENKTLDGNIFKVVDLFDQGRGQNRLLLIQSMRKLEGDGVFERDLEKILMHHTQASSIKEAMEDRLSLIKAAYVSLAVMGNDTNQNFDKDLEFILKFVKSKINHQSIVDDKLKPVKGAVGAFLKAVSWMALAFAPVQLTGQTLDGLWQDIKLVITKPDGQETFTKENMTTAAKTVYSDLLHSSDDPTITSALNAFYGINDMDSMSFADNNSSNRHGVFNFFGKFAYKFSQRPDYYNRMTIFTAQMLADGSWKAHSVDENGNLKYNWKEDDRFAAYANDPSGKNGKTDAWKLAKALYYTVAKQMINEGVKDSNGNLFKLGTESEPTALPKAYSNKESEARKAVGDNVYGYFDSTKKAMIHNTLGGCMLFLMRTYWSAKKNKYLGHGGVKAQGKWVQAEQNITDPNTGETRKEKIFYAKKEDGSIDENRWVPESDPSCSDVPFLQWQGKYEEGILLTMWDFLKIAVSKGSFKDAKEAKFGDSVDPEMRKTYITNMRTFAADLVLWFLIGTLSVGLLQGWADDEMKDAKKSGNVEDAMLATFANLAYRTVRYSSMDFAWWNSIFEPMLDWNPMVLSHVANDISGIVDVAMGDKSFCDALVNSFSAARQMKPMFTYIEDEMKS